MVSLEVLLESIIVDIVLVLAIARLSVTDVTSLVLVSAVGIQLVIPVEALVTEFTFRVAFKSTLVNSAGCIISKLFVLAKLRDSEQLVLVCKDLFIPSTQITL